MARLLPIPVGDIVKKVDHALASVDDVLGRVRTLLASLEEELALVRQVPAIAAKVDDIHRIVSALEPKP